MPTVLLCGPQSLLATSTQLGVEFLRFEGEGRSGPFVEMQAWT